jgi:hypothetical protein
MIDLVIHYFEDKDIEMHVRRTNPCPAKRDISLADPFHAGLPQLLSSTTAQYFDSKATTMDSAMTHRKSKLADSAD